MGGRARGERVSRSVGCVEVCGESGEVWPLVVSEGRERGLGGGSEESASTETYDKLGCGTLKLYIDYTIPLYDRTIPAREPGPRDRGYI